MRPAMVLLLAIAAECGTSGDDEPAPNLLRASEFRSERIEEIAEAASERVRTRGFAAHSDPWRGFLVENSAETREIAMRAGTCYVALAVGSRAVQELDLRVFDSDGGELAQDATAGPLAALRFCPAQSGTHYVAVRAAVGSGLYTVRAFRGPTGLEVRVDDLVRELAPPPETP